MMKIQYYEDGDEDKGWIHGLINYMVKTLGREILLVGLEFEDPLKTLRGK